MNLKYLFLISALMAQLYGWSQLQFNFNDSLPVKKLGAFLKNPWAGGLNFTQFSDLDIDFDGDLDLVAFDRSNNQLRLFRHDVVSGIHSYRFDPMGDSYFPADLKYRVTFYDFDLDGKKDLFTQGVGGIRVYRNVGNAQLGPAWVLFKNLIYSNYSGMVMGLYVSAADVPALVDVDADQDMDILTFSIAGDHVEYHKNMSMETYGHADSLTFLLKNKCWGDFGESVTSGAVTLFDNSSLCSTGNVPNPELPEVIKPEDLDKAHSGSTLLALDIDNSGVMDLIIGDVSGGNLTLLINGGTSANSNSQMISSNPSFPSNSVPVNLQIFPAAFYLDVDFDGKKDILTSPNAKGTSENESSVWFYKNIGSVTQPTFVYQTKAFLQQDMIEHGLGSIPVFADVTSDGLPDMFIANMFAYKPVLQKESRIAYYKNTGTSSQPEFTFIDDDFLNLSQMNLGFRMVPTFGDLNGDGKPDLVLGLENGSLTYFQNTSTGSNPTFATGTPNYTGGGASSIQIGQYAAPQLFDLNGDALLDLVIGEKTGRLLYYQNEGTSSSPMFQLMSNQIGGIDIETSNTDGFPYPHFFKVGDTTMLLVGGYDGRLRLYDSIDLNLTGNFSLKSFPFLGLNLGAFASPFTEDLDNDGRLDLYLGQDLGGVFRLENQEGSNLGIIDGLTLDLEVYPNPFSGTLNIRSEQVLGLVVLYDVYGHELQSWAFGHSTAELNLDVLTSGVYFLKSERHERLYKVIKY